MLIFKHLLSFSLSDHNRRQNRVKFDLLVRFYSVLGVRRLRVECT